MDKIRAVTVGLMLVLALPSHGMMKSEGCGDGVAGGGNRRWFLLGALGVVGAGLVVLNQSRMADDKSLDRIEANLAELKRQEEAPYESRDPLGRWIHRFGAQSPLGAVYKTWQRKPDARLVYAFADEEFRAATQAKNPDEFKRKFTERGARTAEDVQRAESIANLVGSREPDEFLIVSVAPSVGIDYFIFSSDRNAAYVSPSVSDSSLFHGADYRTAEAALGMKPVKYVSEPSWVLPQMAGWHERGKSVKGEELLNLTVPENPSAIFVLSPQGIDDRELAANFPAEVLASRGFRKLTFASFGVRRGRRDTVKYHRFYLEEFSYELLFAEYKRQYPDKRAADEQIVKLRGLKIDYFPEVSRFLDRLESVSGELEVRVTGYANP